MQIINKSCHWKVTYDPERKLWHKIRNTGKIPVIYALPPLIHIIQKISLTNNSFKFHWNPPELLEFKRWQAYFTQKLIIKGSKQCQSNSSRKSRYNAQLGIVTYNPVKFHWNHPNAFVDEARTRLPDGNSNRRVIMWLLCSLYCSLWPHKKKITT
jgi:hypothetical protein